MNWKIEIQVSVESMLDEVKALLPDLPMGRLK
jgi:hypothetical protein